VPTDFGGNRRGLDVADDRLERRDADDEQDPVGGDREREVRERAGEQDQDATPHRLAVVGLAQLPGRDRTFALVEEFDVTA
jgi:hypothetical protein